MTPILTRIIQKARARDPSLPRLTIPPPFGYHDDDGDTEESGSLMDVASGLGPGHSDDASDYAAQVDTDRPQVKRKSLSALGLVYEIAHIPSLRKDIEFDPSRYCAELAHTSDGCSAYPTFPCGLSRIHSIDSSPPCTLSSASSSRLCSTSAIYAVSVT